jgi:iron-sulfur cluster insertion protein
MILLTESALEKVKNLLDQQNQIDLIVRISVIGGGCSGFSYSFGFDTELSDDDINISPDENYKVIIDAISLQYLKDATVDYITEFADSKFVINNPNVVSSCGCGNSFNI